MTQADGTAPTPYRSMREATKISLRELARRTGINSGRLSVIERGIPPTDTENALLLRELGALLAGPAQALGLPLEKLDRGTEPA